MFIDFLDFGQFIECTKVLRIRLAQCRNRKIAKNQPDNGNGQSFVNESFSPLFLAGMLGKVLPHHPIDFVLQKMTDNLCRAHPAVVKRLAPLDGKCFLIKPRDLSYKIRLEFKAHKINAHLDKGISEPVDVKISGSLKSLIAMINGKEDGDALFFSRKITVEGDTEALLTLRNAVDSDDIDLMAEINDNLGVFKTPFNKVVDATSTLSKSLKRDMNLINQALIEPLLFRLGVQEQEMGILREKVAGLEQENQKIKKFIKTIKRKAN